MTSKCVQCEREFAPRDHRQRFCSKDCRSASDSRREAHLRWKINNREAYLRASRKGKLKFDYGMSVEEFDAMSVEQQGRCAICCRVPDHRLHVDHDHATGQIRRLLCRGCNLAIGYLKDSPDLARAAADYLDSFAQF